MIGSSAAAGNPKAQIAATVAAFVGKDYHHDVPQAALPIAGMLSAVSK